jgi:hypothetical protein
MSLPTTIAKAILETVLSQLALLFLTAANGNTEAAREAAAQMLAAHDPQTPDEITLAAQIVTLQFHALEALGNAAEPGLSLNRILRLRGSAVSLSRESHKARRRLEQIQRARQTEAQAPQAQQPQPAQPNPDPAAQQALDLLATAQETIRAAQRTGGKNWRQNLEKRLLTAKITEAGKAQAARYAAQKQTAA